VSASPPTCRGPIGFHLRPAAPPPGAMGGSYSCEPDQDSIGEPGKKVILVSELPDVTHDGLINGILDVLRFPVIPHIMPLLRDVELTEHDDNCFTVKVILDGAKLDAAGFGDGAGSDKVMVWQKVTYKPDESLIITESYTPPGDNVPSASKATQDKVYHSSHTRVLKDPVRLEYYIEMDGQRLHGQAQADILKPYVDSVLALTQQKKVNFTPESDSQAVPGKKCCVSDPMDQYFAYDRLFAALHDQKSLYGDTREITEVSENEVFVTGIGGVEPVDGTMNVQWDIDAGKIVRINKAAGKVKETYYTHVLKDPLRIEIYREDADGKNLAGKRLARFMALAMEELIKKESSWW